MGNDTKIQWTDATHNSWRGCTKATYINKRARVFTASLSDVLDPEGLHVERNFCAGTRRGATRRLGGLDWQLLTKRPENWRWIPEDVRPLVWLGTSVSDQETADIWVPRLLEAEGFRYRFLSAEPLLGHVNLSAFMGGPYVGIPGDVEIPNYNFGIAWIIVGGESGPKARPCSVEWIRDILRQCREAGVKAFCKQLGAQVVDISTTWNDWRSRGASFFERQDGRGRVILSHPKGGDWDEWPEDLRVREMPR